jgi:hypothetical protein
MLTLNYSLKQQPENTILKLNYSLKTTNERHNAEADKTTTVVVFELLFSFSVVFSSGSFISFSIVSFVGSF